MTRTTMLNAAILVAIACSLPAAYAEDAVAQTEQGDTEATPSWTLKPVEVTARRGRYTSSTNAAATRTDTPLIEVPRSVQVITSTLLQEQDRRTLGEALVNVSGVTPTRSDENLFIPPIVRGFPAEVYLDGLPLFAGNQQAYDPTGVVGISSISVLKGPSATLYGGGLGTPLGGIINIESERPDPTASRGYMAVRAGSFSTFNPYADINVPLSPTIAARISAEYQKNDSWIDKVHGERWSIQPSLLFQLSPDTELLLQGQFNRRRSLEYSGLPADAALAGRLDRDAFPGSPNGQPLTSNDSRMATASLRHAFSDRVTLNVTARYFRGKVDESGSFVFPGLAATQTTPPDYDVFPISMVNRTKEATLDANLQAKHEMLGGTHTLLAGVNYDWTSFYSGMGLFLSDSPSGTINLANPRYDLSYTAQLPVNSYTDDRFTTFAGYVQDQATYGRLHLTGALRLTSLTFVENSNIGVANDKTYTHLSPQFGATYDVVPGVALFAGYSTAFRAPFGFMGLATPEPETSTNVEGGLKLFSPGSGLSGTFALFRQTREDVAVADPGNVGFSVQSGRQRARGVEVDMVWEPTPAFSLLANFAHTDAQDNGISPGDRVARVPDNSGRIAARYRWLNGPAKGLSLGAGATAVSARELTLPNTIAVPGYAVFDAQASYDLGRFTLGLSLVNLTGRKAWDPYSYMGYPVVAPSQPRSAYATLTMDL
ncbi:TonB-dependent siderophore receptor [Xanthomonas nasturtii]|uniref:TonB-dependent siderophore receptor n=1 Tax=Xanthomonas nasturtii TaxID=1843581 RepID=A0ABT0LVI2_9XANT|nr:TonB-dependent siderophore receptor [Xanthomonas nasturtii]MCL1553345.1 TonB-dependent siderophore receptor [Xanthomonas nasturtii]MCL1557438.1 TonB-dependent siderophore receptor [Xanthomonas nasturtii]MCL1561082.1 TonB-dependent siderophore receptor [Xanthomonas nasturtii]